MLGNIERESPTINPGNQQGTGEGKGNAWGLIQWDPHSILVNWTAQHGWDWYDGNAQCELIAEEIETPMGAWIPTQEYPYTGQQFTQLTDVNLATRVYLACRERAGVEAIEQRLYWANYWYDVLSGITPPEPPEPPTPPPPTEYHSMPLWFYLKRKI